MKRMALHRLWTDKNGATAIMAALMMPVLVGGLGLGAETGYRYFNHRVLQHAADFSAHAGAVRKSQEDAKPAIDAAALNVAIGSEFTPASDPVPPEELSLEKHGIRVNIPPLSGKFAGDSSAVEVILRETRPRLLSAIFSDEPVQIEVRAVAAVTDTGSSGCILALSENDPTTSGALTVTGSTHIELTGCSVASNSTASDAFDMSGMGSTMAADCVETVGGATETSNLTLSGCASPVENALAVKDPYANVPEPVVTGTCQSKNVGKPNQITNFPAVATSETTYPTGFPGEEGIPVYRFCNGLDAKGTVNFAPGIYIIESGSLTSSGTSTASLSGAGVMFYFTNGAEAKIGANTTLSLSAQTEGPYSGILFFGGRDQTDASHSISGSSTSTMTGAVYFPSSHLAFSGNSTGANGCTQIIADTITLTGNSSMAVECEGTGTRNIQVGQVVALVE